MVVSDVEIVIPMAPEQCNSLYEISGSDMSEAVTEMSSHDVSCKLGAVDGPLPQKFIETGAAAAEVSSTDAETQAKQSGFLSSPELAPVSPPSPARCLSQPVDTSLKAASRHFGVAGALRFDMGSNLSPSRSLPVPDAVAALPAQATPMDSTRSHALRPLPHDAQHRPAGSRDGSNHEASPSEEGTAPAAAVAGLTVCRSLQELPTAGIARPSSVPHRGSSGAALGLSSGTPGSGRCVAGMAGGEGLGSGASRLERPRRRRQHSSSGSILLAPGLLAAPAAGAGEEVRREILLRRRNPSDIPPLAASLLASESAAAAAGDVGRAGHSREHLAGATNGVPGNCQGNCNKCLACLTALLHRRGGRVLPGTGLGCAAGEPRGPRAAVPRSRGHIRRNSVSVIMDRPTSVAPASETEVVVEEKGLVNAGKETCCDPVKSRLGRSRQVHGTWRTLSLDTSREAQEKWDRSLGQVVHHQGALGVPEDAQADPQLGTNAASGHTTDLSVAGTCKSFSRSSSLEEKPVGKSCCNQLENPTGSLNLEVLGPLKPALGITGGGSEGQMEGQLKLVEQEQALQVEKEQAPAVLLFVVPDSADVAQCTPGVDGGFSGVVSKVTMDETKEQCQEPTSEPLPAGNAPEAPNWSHAAASCYLSSDHRTFGSPAGNAGCVYAAPEIGRLSPQTVSGADWVILGSRPGSSGSHRVHQGQRGLVRTSSLPGPMPSQPQHQEQLELSRMGEKAMIPHHPVFARAWGSEGGSPGEVGAAGNSPLMRLASLPTKEWAQQHCQPKKQPMLTTAASLPPHPLHNRSGHRRRASVDQLREIPGIAGAQHVHHAAVGRAASDKPELRGHEPSAEEAGGSKTHGRSGSDCSEEISSVQRMSSVHSALDAPVPEQESERNFLPLQGHHRTNSVPVGSDELWRMYSRSPERHRGVNKILAQAASMQGGRSLASCSPQKSALKSCSTVEKRSTQPSPKRVQFNEVVQVRSFVVRTKPR